MKEYRLDRYPINTQSEKNRAEYALNQRGLQGFQPEHLQVTEGETWAYLTVVYAQEIKEGGKTE